MSDPQAGEPWATVESVFGSKSATTDEGRRGTIPEDVRTRLGNFRQALGLNTAEKVRDLKARYVEILNRPAVQKVPLPARYTIAMRILPGVYGNMEFAPKSEGFVFRLSSVTGRPMKMTQGRSEGTFMVPLFGLAKSTDDANPFMGPVRLLVFGFKDENQARGVADHMGTRPGSLWVLSAQIAQGSPRGILTKGQVGTLNTDAAGTFDPAPAGTPVPWPEPDRALFESISETPILDVLQKPAPRAIYHVVGAVEAGALTAQAEGRQGGWLRILDESVKDRATLDRFGGGLHFFLPRGDIAKARLPAGSLVEALVTGYERKERSPTDGNATGNTLGFTFNALAIGVLFANEDPNGGTPSPGATAVPAPAGGPAPPSPIPAGATTPTAPDAPGLGLGPEE